MSRLLVNLFLFSVVLGVVSQALLQLSLFAPLNDASVVGAHLNQYDIQVRKQKETARKNAGQPKALLGDGEDAKKGRSANNNDNNDNVDLDFLKTVEQLGEIYGTGANLGNAEARDLYHQVLADTRKSFDAWIDGRSFEGDNGNDQKNGKDDELEHASMLCSVARSRVRRYVRDRMADRFGAWTLFARDAWTHGGRYLASSIFSDTKHAVSALLGLSESKNDNGEGKTLEGRRQRSESLRLEATGVPFKASDQHQLVGGGEVSKTGATFSSIGACLTADDHSPCPSFSYLKHVRGKDAKAILKSCFNSNEYYDRYFSRAKKSEDAEHLKEIVVDQ